MCAGEVRAANDIVKLCHRQCTKIDKIQATWCWRDPNEMELPKRLVVRTPTGSHRTLPFEDLGALVQRINVLRHCRCTVAAVAAAVAAAAVGLKWKMTCKVLLSVFPCSRFSLSLHGTFPVSRTSCAALVAARHTLRRSRAVCKCGPLLTRTHHALCHHVMCLFDTWLSSCSEFTFFPCSSWAVNSPSCPSWAFTLLTCSPWASASLSCSVRSS